MSRVNQVRIPRSHLHKHSGQAVVRLSGRDFYLGPWGTQKAEAEYQRVVGEWLACNGRLPATRAQTDKPELTISEMLSAFLDYAKQYYRRDGQPTKEVERLKMAMRFVAQRYGHTPASQFGPLALKAVRHQMIEKGLCRNMVNNYVGRIKFVFKWAVSEELVPPTVFQALSAVSGLRLGRSEARESEPVRPVPDTLVDGIRDHVSRQVWAMIELQRLTGMRPGEVMIMRACDLDVTGDVWLYRPYEHKTQHHGHERIVDLGPRAQAIVKQFLKLDRQAFLFSPKEAEAERSAERRRERKTPMTPSQAKRRRKTNPKRAPMDRYTTNSYRRAIERGCELAFRHPDTPHLGAEHLTRGQRTEREKWEAEHAAELKAWRKAHRWHPHQLRHNFATRIRKEYGLETARVLLGHRSMAVSEIYAEIDREKVAGIVAEVG